MVSDEGLRHYGGGDDSDPLCRDQPLGMTTDGSELTHQIWAVRELLSAQPFPKIV